MAERAGDGVERGIILATLVLLGAFLIWADRTSLDLITRGEGRVVAIGQNRNVQVAQSGTIDSILVQSGQSVQEGQILALINPIEATGTLNELTARKANLDLKRLRLEAELSGRPLDLPSALTAQVDPVLIAAETGLMAARISVLESKLAALMQARVQKEREYQSAVAASSGLENTLRLLETERDEILPLVELGVLGVTEEFRLNGEFNDVTTQLEIATETQAVLAAGLAEIDAEMAALQDANRNDISRERADVLAQLGELTTRLPALQQRLQQTELRAPVNGVVNQVFVNSVDAVVSAGDPIIEIVPNDGALQIVVDIAPEHIATIEPGQPAQIALTAFDATRYGYIDGTVLRVSADAAFNDQQQRRMFSVETTIDSALTDASGAKIAILPGMIAQVSIIRGKRTILEYIWQPVARTKELALRE